MGTELFTNGGLTTVSSGGTTAPAAGTSESWTVASSSTFPAAVANGTQFRVIDPDNPYEVMLVTNVSGTTWTVTRGWEGTPVLHASGFTVLEVISAGLLSGFTQKGGLGMTQAMNALAAVP
jgi:hypothetical protein